MGSGAGGLGAAGVAAAADEMTAEGQAAVVFERRTGLEPDGGVLSLFFPAQVNRNERLLYGAEPGSFGQALRDADIGTGVVGNAGTSVLDQSTREVVLAMADRHGQVTTGQVGGSLLVGLWFARVTGIDRRTALLGTCPGGMAEMVALAEESSARVDLVIGMHLVRKLVLLTATIALVALL